eukprot:scaffold190658_cov19-Tisochrysis_lutea.AAC.1
MHAHQVHAQSAAHALETALHIRKPAQASKPTSVHPKPVQSQKHACPHPANTCSAVRHTHVCVFV